VDSIIESFTLKNPCATGPGRVKSLFLTLKKVIAGASKQRFSVQPRALSELEASAEIVMGE
jgi:hypothetical protein